MELPKEFYRVIIAFKDEDEGIAGWNVKSYSTPMLMERQKDILLLLNSVYHKGMERAHDVHTAVGKVRIRMIPIQIT